MAAGDTRQKPSMVAMVANQGKTRWMIVEETFNADKPIALLQALINDVGRKAFLALDNLRVHHHKLVQSLGG